MNWSKFVGNQIVNCTMIAAGYLWASRGLGYAFILFAAVLVGAFALYGLCTYDWRSSATDADASSKEEPNV